MPFQSNAATEELVRTLEAQRKKLEDDREVAECMLKKTFFFLNSKLGRLQTDISTELLALQKQLADQEVPANAAPSLNFKHATTHILLRMRVQYEELLARQREQAIRITDIHDQNAEHLDYLIDQNMRTSACLEAQYSQATELQKKLTEGEKNIAQRSKQEEARAQENLTLARKMEDNKKETQSLRKRLEDCKKDAAKVNVDHEQQRKTLLSEHTKELRLAEESAREREKENLSKVHLTEMQCMEKSHNRQLVKLQQKLDNTNSKALAQRAEDQKAIKQWEFQFQQFKDQSIADEAHSKKAHREELVKVQAELEGLSRKVSSLKSDVEDWKAAYDELSEKHDTMIKIHTHQLSEQAERQEKESCKHGEEMKLTVAKCEVALQQERAMNAKASSDMQMQLAQAKTEAEQFKRLWTETSAQIVSLKQSSSQVLAELNAKHASDLSGHEQELEIRNLEVQLLTSQLSAFAVTHASDLNTKDVAVKKLQEEVRSTREELLHESIQKKSMLLERDDVQKDVTNALNEISQLRDHQGDSQKYFDPAKTETNPSSTDLMLQINSLEADIYDKDTTINHLEAEHQRVVARLQNDLKVATSREENLRYQLAAGKEVLEKDLEKVSLSAGRMVSHYAAVVAEHDAKLKAAQEKVKNLVSQGEARDKELEAQLKDCRDEIASLHKDRENLVEQNRSLEAATAQTCSSDYASPHSRMVAPEEKKHKSGKMDERVLEEILQDCEDLQKAINEAARMLHAQEDERRKLNTEYADLQKDFGQSFSWRTGKQKGLGHPQ